MTEELKTLAIGVVGFSLPIVIFCLLFLFNLKKVEKFMWKYLFGMKDDE